MIILGVDFSIDLYGKKLPSCRKLDQIDKRDQSFLCDILRESRGNNKSRHIKLINRIVLNIFSYTSSLCTWANFGTLLFFINNVMIFSLWQVPHRYFKYIFSKTISRTSTNNYSLASTGCSLNIVPYEMFESK